MGNMTDWGLWIFVPGFAVLIAIYFLPGFIAFRRKHRNRIAIFVINAFLGFTGIGWVVALIWAFTSDIESQGGESETDPNRQRPRVPPTL